MKLLNVSMDATPYADRSLEVKVAEQFVKQGHDVTLVVERMPEWPEHAPRPEGLNVVVEPVNDVDKASSIAHRLPTDVDAAFATSVSGAPILQHYKQRSDVDVPVVCQVLDVPLWRLDLGPDFPWFNQWKQWFDALLEMTALVTNTQQTHKDLVETSALYQYGSSVLPPVTTVYYGADVDMIDKADPITWPDDVDVPAWTVSVGRLVPYKGFDVAMMAMNQLTKHERPGFAVMGNGPDMERLVHLASLTEAIVAFQGGVTDHDKFRTVKAADYSLCLTHNNHIGSLFPQESVACGVPCIVPDLPIMHEKCEDHGVTYVDPFNAAEVALTIEQWNKPDNRPSPQDMDEARHWVRNNRSTHSHAKGLLRLLTNLVNDKAVTTQNTDTDNDEDQNEDVIRKQMDDVTVELRPRKPQQRGQGQEQDTAKGDTQNSDLVIRDGGE